MMPLYKKNKKLSHIFIFCFVLFIIFISGIEKAIGQSLQPGAVSREYIEEYTQKAIESYREGNYKGALEHIRHVITADMQNLKLRYLAAHSHWKSKNYKSAEAHFKALISFKNDIPSAYTDLALLFVEKKEYEKAYDIIKDGIKVLKRNNHDMPVKFLNVISRIYLYQNQPKEALTNTAAAKARFNKHKENILQKQETLMLESRAYLLNKDFAKAEVSALWATELGVKNEYALNLLGYIYLLWAESVSDQKKKRSLYKNAKENFEKALYHLDKSSYLQRAINKNLARVVL